MNYYNNITKGHCDKFYIELFNNEDDEVSSINFSLAYEDGCVFYYYYYQLLFPSNNKYIYCTSNHQLNSNDLKSMGEFWDSILLNIKAYLKFLGFKYKYNILSLVQIHIMQQYLLHLKKIQSIKFISRKFATVPEQHALIIQLFYCLKYFHFYELQESLFDFFVKDITYEDGHPYIYKEKGKELLTLIIPTYILIL